MAHYNEYLAILCFGVLIQMYRKVTGADGESSSGGHGSPSDKKEEGVVSDNNEPESNSSGSDGASSSKSTAFSSFQRQFLFVYLIMMAADWLQGPYVYELYAHYGFSRADNGVLFIAGFGSSLVFGTWAGPLADRYGRKVCCLLYGVSYALSCFTKHFANFQILMVGRLLGGFATSILWSAFEAWMVSEHFNRKFPKKDVESTFGLMFMLNGLVAIASGFVAQAAVAYVGHPVAPFDVSAVFLIVGSIFIYFSWPENYGDETVPMIQQFGEAFAAIKKDKNVFYVGLMQALFEGAMYTFVFLWTPALSSKEGESIPHGLIFSCFMTASSIGGSMFGWLNKRGGLKATMIKIFAGAVACMSVPVFTSNDDLIMIAFICFEIVVGLFWPCIGSLRAEYVPENCRATVTNCFRIPLNLIVCGVLMMQSEFTVAVTFLCCCALHGAGFMAATHFSTMSGDKMVAGVSKEDLPESESLKSVTTN